MNRNFPKNTAQDLWVDYLFSSSSLENVSYLVTALAHCLEENGKGDNRLGFTDREGQIAGFVEKLTGNDPEDYRVKTGKRGVKLLQL